MKDVLIKKIAYKARYRGIKEADKIIGGFVASVVPTLSMDDLHQVLIMLDLSDHDILAMMAGTKKLDPSHLEILTKMKQYFNTQNNCRIQSDKINVGVVND